MISDIFSMTPVYCQECGRANGATAPRCIWCGIPIIQGGAPLSFDTTRVEIDYLDGIERLDNPAPMRLVINRDGLEISELMPGTRTIRIAAESIIRADVVDASTEVEPKRAPFPFLKILIFPFGLLLSKKKPTDPKLHDYLLNIRYKAGGEIRNAVFHRQDRAGLSIVEGLARIINMLVRLQTGKSSDR
ncbi:MAG: hypothetical protein WBV94_01180 [Blastocatellia bacterium]